VNCHRHGARAARRRRRQEPVKKGGEHTPVNDPEPVTMAGQNEKRLLGSLWNRPVKIGAVVF
jgi:hypothetical protein